MDTELKPNWKTNCIIGLVLGSSGPDLTHFFPVVKDELHGYETKCKMHFILFYFFKNATVVVRC